MIINKYLERKILKDCFFIEGKINLDADYFIKKINKSIASKENENYTSYVKSQMTPWAYFRKDEKFNSLLKELIKEVDVNLNMPNYSLEDCWGYCMKEKENTEFHTHYPNLWSGVIYLNKHPQKLEFPQINQCVKPEKGKFALFSSMLEHGCKINKSVNKKYGISFNMRLMTIGELNSLDEKKGS